MDHTSRSEMKPEVRELLNLDLRHVMFMQNAAEPVRASTVSRQILGSFS